MAKKNLDTVLKKQLNKLYNEDLLSISEISTMLDVSESALRHWFKRFNIKTRTRREAMLIRSMPTKKDLVKNFFNHNGGFRDEEGFKNLLKKLYCDDAKTSIEIGEMLGVNKAAICSWLRMFGIKIRSRGERYYLHFKNNPLYKKFFDVEGEIKDPKKLKEYLDKLYNIEELTLEKIGNMFNVSTSFVKRKFDYLNIQRRPPLGVKKKTFKKPIYIKKIKTDLIKEFVDDSGKIKNIIKFKKHLQKLYLNDCLTLKEIGNLFGYDRSTVGLWFSELKIKKRRNCNNIFLLFKKNELIRTYFNQSGRIRNKDTFREQLKKFSHNDGLTLREIGELFSCRKETVGLWFKQLGIKTKPKDNSEKRILKTTQVARALNKFNKKSPQKTERVTIKLPASQVSKYRLF